MLGKLIIAGLVAVEGTTQVVERSERVSVFDRARSYASSLDKPLLVVGSPKNNPFSAHHQCGDVTIDLDPNLDTYCDYEIADIREIPYGDHVFGAAYVSHVLEHLSTVEDAGLALNELERVADKVFIVSPHKSSLIAWLHPEHHLWITPDGDGYKIEQRGPGLPREECFTIRMMTA